MFATQTALGAFSAQTVPTLPGALSTRQAWQNNQRRAFLKRFSSGQGGRSRLLFRGDGRPLCRAAVGVYTAGE
jgi:hypothetical protein